MLFQVKQKYDEDDLWALHNLEKKKHHIHEGVVIYIQLCALMAILTLIGSLIAMFWAVIALGGTWIIIPMVFAWAVFIPNAIFLLVSVAFPKGINEKSLNKQEEQTYTFFDDYFSIEGSDSAIDHQYSVITKFVEKGDHFFIFIDTNVAYVIRKSCFILGRPEDFGPFMREKYRTKDMDTPEKGLDET